MKNKILTIKHKEFENSISFFDDGSVECNFNNKISVGYIYNKGLKCFQRDEMPGANVNEDIRLLNSGLVWSMGCGYSGFSDLYEITEEEREMLKTIFI